MSGSQHGWAQQERAAAESTGEGAEDEPPTCAWPDGCDNVPPRVTGGRPAEHCGRRVNGKLHTRQNAARRREALAREHDAGANERDTVRGEVDLAQLGSSAQAQHVVDLLGQLATLPAELGRYRALLEQVGDVDAAARQIEGNRRQADADIADARRETDAARAELDEHKRARADADAALDAAATREEERIAEAEAARIQAETDRADRDAALADAETARTEAADEIAHIRAEAESRITEAQRAAAHEIESVRAECERQVTNARDEAQEAGRTQARAEQAATDAREYADRLRAEWDQDRDRRAREADDLRARATNAERDAIDAWQTYARDLQRLTRQPAHVADHRPEDDHAETAEQDTGDSGADDADQPWEAGLPEALVTTVHEVYSAHDTATHGGTIERKAIPKDLNRRLDRLRTTLLMQPTPTVGTLTREVLRPARRAGVPRALAAKYPELARNLRTLREQAKAYLSGTWHDGDEATADTHDQEAPQ